MARALALVPFFFAFTLLAACGDDDRPGTGGECSPVCAVGQGCCNRTCVALNTASNCGRCGVACSAGQSCEMGMCVGGTPTDGGTMMSTCTPECAASQRCCGGACVDRQAPAGTTDGRTHPSFENCNGCGISCDPERASVCGPSGCMCGATGQCPTGQICGVNPAGVVSCVSTEFDRNNCGGVGIVCGEGETCVNGMCGCGTTGARCGEGQGCCGGACVDTSTDNSNCGSCGTMCGDGMTCAASQCRCGGAEGPVCTIGSGAGMLGQVCCSGACVNVDASNCGACGSACDGSQCVWGAPLTGGTPGPCCGQDLLGMAICLDFGGGGFP